MKKIFLMFVAICAYAACDPGHEDIGNAGHISIDELKAKTSVCQCKVGYRWKGIRR